jgi:hypothetical protein
MAKSFALYYMKSKKLIVLFFLTLVFAFNTHVVSAQERASASSARITTADSETNDDYRIKILKSYLEKHNSPLAQEAANFVKYADEYNLDWKFVAAISGLESTFGQQIPYNSYNAWGWGIYGDNMIRFNSWEEGIQTISQGLREKYMDKWGAQDVYQIGSLYASSPTWAQRVSYLMDNIEDYALKNPKDTLLLSL